jgi:alpha-L-arabinofuranosidase
MLKKYITCLIAITVGTSIIIGCSNEKAKADSKTNLYTLNINADEKKFNVSDMLTGLFFEDINNGADGGLYAELVENRSFEFKNSMNSWVVEKKGGSQGDAVAKKDSPLNSNNPTYVEMNSTSNGDGLRLVNDGYKGITTKSGNKYYYSFWAKNVEGQAPINLQVEDSTGQVISETKTVENIGKEWTKYEGELIANKDESAAKFVIYTKGTGKIDLDMISLFPQGTWKDRKYGLRKDLVERLSDLKPKFMRFPGGCVVEGHTKDQMYNWKNTIGKVEERKEIENMWGYYQSYGLGFYEYFQLCEDLGAVPVPVVNCGMTCQGGIHAGKSAYMASDEELNTYIQDALDLIEYSNGDETTTWGKKRVEAGHKEPFNLKYLAVGNEQWGTEYHKRFEAFQKVLNEKHPEITLISAAGPIAEGPLINDAWSWIKSKADKTVVDEHYYMDPDWFLNNTERYDSYDRNGPKVFLGEYASQSNSLRSALAEAAYLTGLERNSDVVKMASYAPLFAKFDNFQWAPNMIWFNGKTNYATPNYYVQKIFGTNLGTQMLKDELVKPEVKKSNDITGGVVLGSWSTKVEYDNVKVTDNKTGKEIFSDNFDKDNSEWNKENGNWTVKDGKLVIDEIKDDCKIQTNSNNWSNYTLELTAKKNGGNEGFLVGFGAKDAGNYYWLNIGGWGNTKTVIEKAVNGGKSTISEANAVYGPVKTGEEYKIKVVVAGDKISCYINDKLTNEVVEKKVDTDIFTSSSYDEKTGDLIVKVVNTSDEAKKVKININSSKKIDSNAKIEYITGDNSSMVNSFEDPEAISIKDKTIDNASKSFDYDADKNSVSVIRLKFK